MRPASDVETSGWPGFRFQPYPVDPYAMTVPPPPAYRIELLPAAARQLRKLPRPAQRQVAKLLDTLAVDPRPAGAKALTGLDGVLRVRSGNYRVAYEVIDRQLLVSVIALGDRREVYRKLRGLT